MVTLQAKQQPPSQQQQQRQQQQQQQASPQFQHRYKRAAQEENLNNLRENLTCDNNKANNDNECSEFDSRDNWSILNDLKAKKRENCEVANFGQEATSSSSERETKNCTQNTGNNDNGIKQNGRGEFDSQENWPFSNNLKSNDKEENRKGQVAEVANFGEETTSSRSERDGESTQCSDIENDDDVEIEEELEEEEEEEVGNYQVEEVDSEDEDDDDGDREPGNQIENSDRWIKKKVVTTKVERETCFGEGYGQSEVIPQMDETTFGEVSITNSKHVHVGNTNFYKGPVTIKQFVYTNACPILDKDDDTEGSSSARVSDINPNDVPIVKCDPNGPILPSYQDYDTDKRQGIMLFRIK